MEKSMAPDSSSLAWKIPWTRGLAGWRPWGREESNMTERLHFHFSLSCIGEGNGSPLQCSCLENPRDRGAWWAAVYGVAQSQTRLKWLSSSSSRLWLLVLYIILFSVWGIWGIWAFWLSSLVSSFSSQTLSFEAIYTDTHSWQTSLFKKIKFHLPKM